MIAEGNIEEYYSILLDNLPFDTYFSISGRMKFIPFFRDEKRREENAGERRVKTGASPCMYAGIYM